jgi:hypothetical protein
MSQNRNKLIDLFIGNLTNAILHRILEKAIDLPEVISKYKKEIITSWDIAKAYREKINPPTALPQKDISEIKEKIIRRVKSELTSRISRGYKNLSLEIVEDEVEKALSEMKIS